MSFPIVFIKPDKVNDHPYKKGDELNVSGSIYKTLKDNGTIKDKAETKKKTKES